MSGSVAVIIPCHDDGRLLSEAVRSLEAEPQLEVVVVNDASRDATTLAILRRLRQEGMRVVQHEINRGLSAARNSGLAATSAPYVFPLDADDLAQPGSIATMAARLDETPAAAVCFGDYLEFGPFELVRRVPPRIDPYRLAFRNELPVTALFRRSALESVGGWTDLPEAIGYEDWDLWLGFAECGFKGVHAGEGLITYRRRVREGSMLSSSRGAHRTLYAALRTRHPTIYGELRRYRRQTDLGPVAARLYPLVFGGRPRPRLEQRLKFWYQRRRWPPPEAGDPSSVSPSE